MSRQEIGCIVCEIGDFTKVGVTRGGNLLMVSPIFSQKN